MNALRQVDSAMFLYPAYGRSYKTWEDIKKDWEAGKDFSMGVYRMGPYCSIRDLRELMNDSSSIWIIGGSGVAYFVG
jgi:hypothetical protein